MNLTQKPELKDNWRQFLEKAWSVRLNILSAILNSMIFVMPFIQQDFKEYSYQFAAVGFVLNLATIWASIRVQKNLPYVGTSFTSA